MSLGYYYMKLRNVAEDVDPLDNLSGLTLFNAYRPQLSGGVTINGGDGNIDSVVDWKSGLDLIRISAPSAPSQGAGGEIVFNSKLLRADALTSDYDFTCNGDDFTVVSWVEMAAIPSTTQYLFATRDGAVTDSGFGIGNFNPNTQFVNIRTGGTNSAFSFSGSFWPDTNRHQLACFFVNNGVASVGWQVYLDGTLIYSGNVDSALNPATTAFRALTVGGSTAASLSANMKVWDLHILKGIATAGDKSTIFSLPYNYYS